MNKCINKNIMTYNKNSYIYSDEVCEFQMIGGTPDGEITLPNKELRIPWDTKEVVVQKDSTIIKEANVSSINEIVKENKKCIEALIKYKVSFNIKLYDKDNELYHIICYLDEYPMPDKQFFIKEFIRVYSIVCVRISIDYNNNDELCVCSDNPKVDLLTTACVKEIKCKLCKEKKYISFYDVNCEEYMRVCAGILIKNNMKILWKIKSNKN